MDVTGAPSSSSGSGLRWAGLTAALMCLNFPVGHSFAPPHSSSGNYVLRTHHNTAALLCSAASHKPRGTGPTPGSLVGDIIGVGAHGSGSPSGTNGGARSGGGAPVWMTASSEVSQPHRPRGGAGSLASGMRGRSPTRRVFGSGFDGFGFLEKEPSTKQACPSAKQGDPAASISLAATGAYTEHTRRTRTPLSPHGQCLSLPRGRALRGACLVPPKPCLVVVETGLATARHVPTQNHTQDTTADASTSSELRPLTPPRLPPRHALQSALMHALARNQRVQRVPLTNPGSAAAGLVPDVIPAEFADTARLEVTYANWVRSAVDLRNPFSFGDTPTRGAGRIESGATITPTQTQDRPTVSFIGEKGALYTVLLTDPDVPSRRNPTRREFMHWLRVNVPGDSDSATGRVMIPGGGEIAAGGGGGAEGGGQDLYTYVGAGPPPNTGLHRYFFLVYKQGGEVDASAKVGMTGVGRAGFKTNQWASSKGLGQPVGWCMFEAEYDSYCDELYAKLREGK